MKRYLTVLLSLFFCLSTCLSLAATRGEQNALDSAKSYLEFMNFSYKGLCDQLAYEGYSTDECIYAADNCGADWYDQAAGSAESYMSFMSFSKKGLIEQLEYEGYTKAEAEYGAAIAYDEHPTKPDEGKSTITDFFSDSSLGSSEYSNTDEQLNDTYEESVPKKVLDRKDATFDLSGLSFSELCSLQEQVNIALWASDEWQEIQVPAGLYRVGVEIPAGEWTVSMNKQWARIKIGSKINTTGNEVEKGTSDYYSVQINKEVPSQKINFFDGMYVEIYNAGLIFTPSTGAQFSFK